MCSKCVCVFEDLNGTYYAIATSLFFSEALQRRISPLYVLLIFPHLLLSASPCYLFTSHVAPVARSFHIDLEIQFIHSNISLLRLSLFSVCFSIFQIFSLSLFIILMKKVCSSTNHKKKYVTDFVNLFFKG